MKKRILICFIAVIGSSRIFAMDEKFTLPASDILEKKVTDAGNGDFARRSGIVAQLANKEMDAYQVLHELNRAKETYKKAISQDPLGKSVSFASLHGKPNVSCSASTFRKRSGRGKSNR